MPALEPIATLASWCHLMPPDAISWLLKPKSWVQLQDSRPWLRRSPPKRRRHAETTKHRHESCESCESWPHWVPKWFHHIPPRHVSRQRSHPGLPWLAQGLLQRKRWRGCLGAGRYDSRFGSRLVDCWTVGPLGLGSKARRTCRSTKFLEGQRFQRPAPVPKAMRIHENRLLELPSTQGSEGAHAMQTRHKNKREVDETGEHLCKESPRLTGAQREISVQELGSTFSQILPDPPRSSQINFAPLPIACSRFPFIGLLSGSSSHLKFPKIQLSRYPWILDTLSIMLLYIVSYIDRYCNSYIYIVSYCYIIA